MMRLLHGDCLDVLPALDAGSVQCCVTSPPYFGLRNYGVDGQIGVEASPAEYVAKLVKVFREVRRVLRDDGTVFLNLGDSYAGGKQGRDDAGRDLTGGGGNKLGSGNPGNGKQRAVPVGCKAKDLLMIPARVAIALQDDGWWLRSDIIWAKKNCMPESVTDRPTSAHEHVFLLSKRASYFYDADAIKEAALQPEGEEQKTGQGRKRDLMRATGTHNNNGTGKSILGSNQGSPFRNARNVWSISAPGYPDAHFATMPPELAERCIKAGTRPGDTVLDPFAGAFTSVMVADRLQRSAIGIELSADYVALARARLVRDAGMFAELGSKDV